MTNGLYIVFLIIAPTVITVNAAKGDIYESSLKAGFVAEPHDVVTDDGYILTIFLIKNPSDSDADIIKKEPVLIQHGLTGSCEHFTVAQNESLAFYLSRQNYSVWLGNTRGSFHSMRHKTLSPKSKEFWQFTMDQNGKYDLPAMIDYILNRTNRKKIIYVGHSQGSGIFYVMAAGDRPEYNEKIKVHVAMSPGVYTKNSKAILFQLAGLNVGLARVFFELLQIYQLPAAANCPLIRAVTHIFCGKNTLGRKFICPKFINLIEITDQSLLEMDYMPEFFDTQPGGMGIYQYLQYGQFAHTGQFSRFNWGEALNRKFFNSSIAAPYNLTKVTAPVSIIYGKNDGIIDAQDVKRLANELVNVVDYYEVPNDKFTHVSFLAAKNLTTLLNAHVLDILNKYKS